MVDEEFKLLLTPERISAIIALIPDEWIIPEWQESPDEVRAIYTQFLNTRIAASAIFVNEAQHAREQPI
jgi:hypothetical protein